MKFYIPKIGDQIILTEDWEFNLVGERRNIDLAALFGYYLYENKWIDEKIIPPIKDRDYFSYINYPKPEDFKNNYLEYLKARIEAEQNCPEYVKYVKDFEIYNEKIKNSNSPYTIPITLLKGTVLKVDRIYIKKNYTDFDSITFSTKILEKIKVKSAWNRSLKNKKSLRFWVHLDYCNNIEFEKIKE